MNMTLRVLTLTLTLVALTGLPTAAADTLTYDRSQQVTTTPRTGEYIDLATNLVYNYNAATGTLTPTGQVGNPAGYICFDIAPRGTALNPGCGWLGTCGWTLCTTEMTAVLGAHTVSYWVDLYTTNNVACGGYGIEYYPPPPGSLVTFTNSLVLIEIYGWCEHGFADGKLYIDGVQRASDSTTF